MASMGPGGRKRATWYLPDQTHELAALVVRLIRKITNALRHLGRARIVDRIRQTANLLGRALATNRLPHSVPPQTPEEKSKVEISSKPTRLQEELQRIVDRAQAKQAARRPPTDGGEGM